MLNDPAYECRTRSKMHRAWFNSFVVGRQMRGGISKRYIVGIPPRDEETCATRRLYGKCRRADGTIVRAGCRIDHCKQVVRFVSLSSFPVCSRHILLIHSITSSITFTTPINQQNDFQNGHWPTPRWGSFATSPRRLLIATRSHAIHWFQQIIATKAKPRRPRQGGAGARRGGTASGATGATGARARYATTVPKTVAAPQPFSAEVFKIIISNLPSDVTDAAVRVSTRVFCFGHSVYVIF